MPLKKYPNLKDFLQTDASSAKREEQPAFLENLLGKLDEHIAKDGKCLIITLTKKSSEEVTNFLISK